MHFSPWRSMYMHATIHSMFNRSRLGKVKIVLTLDVYILGRGSAKVPAITLTVYSSFNIEVKANKHCEFFWNLSVREQFSITYHFTRNSMFPWQPYLEKQVFEIFRLYWVNLISCRCSLHFFLLYSIVLLILISFDLFW